MKKSRFLLFFPVVLLAFVGRSSFSLPIGSNLPKPDLKLMDISGKEVTLGGSQKSSGLLVMFSCNTCPVVIANQSRTNAICQYAATKEIGVVLLNANEANRSESESLEAMRDYAKNQHYQWTYAVDKNSELADAFGANRTPECFLFDKSGKLVYHGAIDDNPSDISGVNRHHLQQAIDEMVQGKSITVKESRSVGCSIKRS
jgi:thioredoxin-related protein